MNEEHHAAHAAPLPAGDLADRPLPLDVITADVVLYRLHNTDDDALRFTPWPDAQPVHRFDDPAARYGVCYVGLSPEASFAETFLRNPPVRLIPTAFLTHKAMATLRTNRSLSVVRLHSDGLAKLGTTAHVSSGSYGVSHAWSRALYEHPECPDGMVYRSRHDDAGLCLALFDRAQSAIVWERSVTLAEARGMLVGLLRRYGIGLT